MTSRTRKRNALRSVAILPPDVEAKASGLRPLDGESQARAVTAMLTHSHAGLMEAIAAQSLPQIMEWKAKAAAIQELAHQLRIGRALQLDAAKFLRRAERGTGVAVREGQKRGVIKTDAEAISARSRAATAQREINQGRRPKNYKFLGDQRPSAADFLTGNERHGAGRGKAGSVFAMTDGVTDEQFEAALAEAEAEGNLSRANVARKARAKAAPAVADPVVVDAEPEQAQPTPAPVEPKKRLTKHNSTEMLANISGMLSGIVESLPFVDPADIDGGENAAVIAKIRNSMGCIRKLLKDIENG